MKFIAAFVLLAGLQLHAQTQTTAKPKKADVFDKDGCNVTYSGVAGCAKSKKDSEDFRKELDKHLHPRDIFHCHDHQNCNEPIRGWTLKFQSEEVFSGSVDWYNGVYVATKGKETQYFWVQDEEGVDAKTDQSISSFRVKELAKPDENPYETDSMRVGLWSDDRKIAWIPGSKEHPDQGVCSEDPLSGIGWSSFPQSREECEKSPERRETYTFDPVTGKEGPHIKGTRVTLKPWKALPPEKKECK